MDDAAKAESEATTEEVAALSDADDFAQDDDEQDDNGFGDDEFGEG